MIIMVNYIPRFNFLYKLKSFFFRRKHKKTNKACLGIKFSWNVFVHFPDSGLSILTGLHFYFWWSDRENTESEIVWIWRAWRHTPTTNSQEYSPVGPASPLFLNQTEAHPPYVRVWIRHWNRRNFINWARLVGSPVSYALNFYPVMNISPKPIDISCSTSCIWFK